MSQLNKSELEYIKNREEKITEMLETFKEAPPFKIGDFLIAFEKDWHGNITKIQIKNSYGAPKKYKIVHVDNNGICYAKEINKKGTPVGHLISLIEEDDNGGYSNNSEFHFEVDPDYTDSIIMMDEENYDSTGIHKMKANLHKEITQHNKKNKIKTQDDDKLAAWFNANVKVGDTLYRSKSNQFTILEISPIKITPRWRTFGGNEIFCKVSTSKGEVKEMSINDFMYTALYTARPRSYNELKDPK